MLLFPIRKDSGNQESVSYLKIDVLISFISTSAGSARVLVLIVAAKLEREKLGGVQDIRPIVYRWSTQTHTWHIWLTIR